MPKLLVEIEMENISAKELMKDMENNREEWFPVGDNMVSINQYYLKNSPERGSFLFKLKGVIDEEAD